LPPADVRIVAAFVEQQPDSARAAESLRHLGCLVPGIAAALPQNARAKHSRALTERVRFECLFPLPCHQQSATEEPGALRQMLCLKRAVAAERRENPDAEHARALRETAPRDELIVAAEIDHDGNGPPDQSIRPARGIQVRVITARIDDQERLVGVDVVPCPADDDLAERRVGFDLELLR
jgi:hypothetical protein